MQRIAPIRAWKLSSRRAKLRFGALVKGIDFRSASAVRYTNTTEYCRRASFWLQHKSKLVSQQRCPTRKVWFAVEGNVPVDVFARLDTNWDIVRKCIGLCSVVYCDRRLAIGGKLLTNYLARILSLRA